MRTLTTTAWAHVTLDDHPRRAGRRPRPGAAPRWCCPKCLGWCASQDEEWSSRGPEGANPVIDDIDGSAAEGTVRFALDGTDYEIDLNAEHAQQLRDALAAYVKAGRRVSGGTRRPARGGRRGPASGLNTTEVREWARTQGIEVKDRGRVPAELVVKFKAATGQ